MKVSFDADGTLLGAQSIRDYAKELIANGHEVWIVTRRYANPDDYGKLFCIAYGIKDVYKEHRQLFEVAKECGITNDHIHFMDMVDKFEFFARNTDFLWHLDDDQLEINDINKQTKTVAISCSNGSNWKNKCERLIKKKLNEKI